MAQTVCILLGDEDRMRLAAVLGDRNRPQKHVQRARIVLLSGEDQCPTEIFRPRERIIRRPGGSLLGPGRAGAANPRNCALFRPYLEILNTVKSIG